LALLATPFSFMNGDMQREATFDPTNSGDANDSRRSESSDINRRAQSVCDDLRRSARESDRLVLPDELCRDLRAAVEKAAVRSAGSINALRLAVKRFTVALRDDGAKPEAVLIALKSVINSRTFPIVDSRAEGWRPDELRQQISTWSVQDFFSEKQA
jgi:hypothetical protein